MERCLCLMGMGKCVILNETNRIRACLPLQSGQAVFGVSISTAVERLLTAKTAGNRKPEYLTSLTHYLSNFQKGREGRLLSDFTTADIEDWLSQFPNANSRQTWLNRISTLFSFAVRRQFVASNPCTRIERIRIDRRAPKILSPEQVDRMLNLQGPHATMTRGYLILGLFAGIRPEELLRLQWPDVNLETKTVTVNDAKTRRRRIVPLHDRALDLLSGFNFKRGPVSPSNSTVRRFKRAAAMDLGWSAWPSDLLRHTFASYALALHGDAGKVSTMMGNSSAILLSHYHEPVSAADCRSFWALPAVKLLETVNAVNPKPVDSNHENQVIPPLAVLVPQCDVPR